VLSLEDDAACNQDSVRGGAIADKVTPAKQRELNLYRGNFHPGEVLYRHALMRARSVHSRHSMFYLHSWRTPMLKFSQIAPIALLTLSIPLWAATSTAAEKKKEVKSPAPSSVEVRDWKAIDTNGDHLISPEEMEKYLHENPGPQQKKKSS
jgi:hypothetical protein